jgi:hypothetical protein
MSDADPHPHPRDLPPTERGALLNVPKDAAAAAIDEAEFRRHFAAHYGEGERFEDYAHAYAIGAALARDPACRGRTWEELREILRSDWEGSGTRPAWAQAEAAVRHARDRSSDVVETLSPDAVRAAGAAGPVRGGSA